MSGLSGKVVVCPYCRSTAVSTLAKDDPEEPFFSIRRPFKCSNCERVFERPSPPVLCAFALLLGLAVAAGGLLGDLPVNAMRLGRGQVSALVIWNLLGGVNAIRS
jgi:DNA-directed RNA polymerase subunit RPC12/RpoP